jgi:SWI/SNF-related matrix-associated actin-dependent regulator 1 of chromatin subfamily A
VSLARRPPPSIAALVRDVVGADPLAREAAVARLAIAGARAEGPVLQALAAADEVGQASLLAVLERLATPRALPAARDHLAAADAVVAAAAVGAVRAHLAASDPAQAAEALDALVAVCLDTTRPEAVRLAAIDALADAGDDARPALDARLLDDPSPRIRRAAAGGTAPAGAAAAAQLEALAAAPGRDPLRLIQLLGEAADTPIAVLHQLVLAVGHQERTAADADRAGWTRALAAAHKALADRGSRLALGDLHDALGRTPVERLGDLVAAASAIGDAACLAPLAAAWTAAAEPVRGRVAAAFAAIVAREGLTRRHAAARDIAARWPAAAAVLLPAASRRA